MEATKIVIGSGSTAVEFENADILSISVDNSVGVIGDELTIDTMETKVRLGDYTPPSVEIESVGTAGSVNFTDGDTLEYFDGYTFDSFGITLNGSHNLLLLNDVAPSIVEGASMQSNLCTMYESAVNGGNMGLYGYNSISPTASGITGTEYHRNAYSYNNYGNIKNKYQQRNNKWYRLADVGASNAYYCLENPAHLRDGAIFPGKGGTYTFYTVSSLSQPEFDFLVFEPKQVVVQPGMSVDGLYYIENSNLIAKIISATEYDSTTMYCGLDVQSGTIYENVRYFYGLFYEQVWQAGQIGTDVSVLNNKYLQMSGEKHLTSGYSRSSGKVSFSKKKLIYHPGQGVNPRDLKWGVPISWYRGTPYALKGQYFVESIKRISQNTYDISCMSIIGVLSARMHPGDVYSGTPFKNVIDKIMEETPGVDYEVQSIPGDTYGFALKSDGYYERTNGGINNSYAYCKLVFNDHGIGPLTLQCIDQAESSYDFGILSKVDTELGHNYSEDSSSLVYHSFKGESSATPKTITYPLMGEGEHYITIKYRKDSSQHTSPDTFKFKVTSSEGTKICDYEVSSDVAGISVNGWLPYDTARSNLHRLLFAYNVALLRAPDDPGKLLFTFLGNDTPTTPGTLYLEGEVEYPAMPKAVKITEHTYGFPKSYSEEEILFDNSSDGIPTAALDVIFKDPIYVSSLRADGSLTFTGYVNYAQVTGNGVLYGKRYEHSSRDYIIETGNETGNTVSVADNGLISLLNSRNVADKLIDYYGNAVKMKASVIMNNEKCGNRYTFTNIFGETVTGLLNKMKLTISGIVKAVCDFVSGLTFPGKGTVYNTVMKYDTEGSGSITIPAGVTRIRAVLIGGGTGGDSGYAGEPGQLATEGAQLGGAGGKGGKGGKGGEGGRVYSVELDVTPGQVISCFIGSGGAAGLGANSTPEQNISGQEGTATTITVGGHTYTSASGARSERGFYDPINKQYHAESAALYPETNGIAGGDGGPGGEQGLNRIIQASAKGRNGQNVINARTTYTGGTGGLGGNTGNLGYIAQANSGYSVGGGGGSGATALSNGNNGTAGSATQRYLSTGNTGLTLKPGNGGDGVKPNARGWVVGQLFGYGGSGGHGGSGGGGAGGYQNFTASYETRTTYVESLTPGTPGAGGKGGDGAPGQHGGILIYYEA